MDSQNYWYLCAWNRAIKIGNAHPYLDSLCLQWKWLKKGKESIINHIRIGYLITLPQCLYRWDRWVLYFQAYHLITDSDDKYTIRGCYSSIDSHLADMEYEGDSTIECSDDMQQGEVCYDLFADGNRVNYKELFVCSIYWLWVKRIHAWSNYYSNFRPLE